MAEEYKQNSLGWRMHSAEVAHSDLERDLRLAKEGEKRLDEKAKLEQSRADKASTHLDQASEQRKAQLAELRARQDVVSENIRETERKRLARVLSPEGQHAGFEAAQKLDFFGNVPESRSSTKKEEKEKTLTGFPLLSRLLGS